MNEGNYTLTSPTPHIKAGEAASAFCRLAARLQVKTLQKLSVPMNYLCKMLK